MLRYKNRKNMETIQLSDINVLRMNVLIQTENLMTGSN